MTTLTDNILVHYLLDNITFSHYEQQAFRRWEESFAISYQEATSAAQQVLRASNSPEGLLEQVFEIEGIMSYIDSIAELEAEIEIAKAELVGHFYRDHATHVIRTFLGAVYAAQEAGVNVNIRSLAIACLFHDMAVPIEEVEEILTTHAETIRRAFARLEVSRPAISVGKLSEIVEFLDDLSSVSANGLALTDSQLRGIVAERLEQKKHDALGAFELWRILRCKEDKTLLRSLLAIALHHAPLGPGAVTTEFPELFLLILADELQEWGRKAFMMGVYQLFEGNQVTVDVTRAHPPKFRFNVSYRTPHVTDPARIRSQTAGPVFSPLKQIKAKIEGLRRLSSSDCEITIGFTMATGYRAVLFDEGPIVRSEIKGQWLRFYKVKQGFPDELLRLSSSDPALLADMNDSFDSVTLKLEGGGICCLLGESEIPPDIAWDADVGYRKLLLRLSQLYSELGTWVIAHLMSDVASGFLALVVPAGLSQEIDYLEDNAGESTYIKELASRARDCLSRFRRGDFEEKELTDVILSNIREMIPEQPPPEKRLGRDSQICMAQALHILQSEVEPEPFEIQKEKLNTFIPILKQQIEEGLPNISGTFYQFWKDKVVQEDGIDFEKARELWRSMWGEEAFHGLANKVRLLIQMYGQED